MFAQPACLPPPATRHAYVTALFSRRQSVFHAMSLRAAPVRVCLLVIRDGSARPHALLALSSVGVRSAITSDCLPAFMRARGRHQSACHGLLAMFQRTASCRRHAEVYRPPATHARRGSPAPSMSAAIVYTSVLLIRAPPRREPRQSQRHMKPPAASEGASACRCCAQQAALPPWIPASRLRFAHKLVATRLTPRLSHVATIG